MDKQVLLATYEKLDTARAVIDELLAMEMGRNAIGLAVHHDDGREGHVLVTVTVDDKSNNPVADILNAHQPLELDARTVQWRQEHSDAMAPDETAFIALPLRP